MGEHVAKNIFDCILFILALILGEKMEPFMHWLAYGSLPHWVEQSAKIIPGALVALYHFRTVKKKKR